MSKQTAVEWLIEEIDKMQKIYIDLNKEDKSLGKGVDAILTATTLLKMKCIHAKEMEKEQIKDAHLIGLITSMEMEATKQSEQYYNETFKNS